LLRGEDHTALREIGVNGFLPALTVNAAPKLGHSAPVSPLFFQKYSSAFMQQLCCKLQLMVKPTPFLCRKTYMKGKNNGNTFSTASGKQIQATTRAKRKMGKADFECAHQNPREKRASLAS